MTYPGRILIACIGNIFLGDDGFGTEVARELANSPLPPGVVLKDFGIRGLDFTYALLEPWELVILVDACHRGEAPGSIYVIEPDPYEPGEEDRAGAPLDPHGMNPLAALRAAHAMDKNPGRILLVGCEPASTGCDDEGRFGLSEPVQAAVASAAAIVRTLVSKSLDGVLAEAALQLQ